MLIAQPCLGIKRTKVPVNICIEGRYYFLEQETIAASVIRNVVRSEMGVLATHLKVQHVKGRFKSALRVFTTLL